MMSATVRYQRIALFAIFAITGGGLVLDRLTSAEINNNIVFFIVLFLAISSLSLMIFEYLFGELSMKVVGVFLAVIFTACFGTAVLSWRGEWKIQTILYKNVSNPATLIVYRMRSSHDGFAFDKQIVQKTPFVPFIDKISAVDTSRIDKDKWIPVNERVNEIGFPGEYIDIAE